MYETAIAEIEARLDEVERRYADEVVPGVSDDSVLEAERDTLEWALGTLRGTKPRVDVLPVLAFEPEAHDTWIGIVDRFGGYGVTLTLADGEEVEAVFIKQVWDEEAADYRIVFYRVTEDRDYLPLDEIDPADRESLVGVRRIRIT